MIFPWSFAEVALRAATYACMFQEKNITVVTVHVLIRDYNIEFVDTFTIITEMDYFHIKFERKEGTDFFRKE